MLGAEDIADPKHPLRFHQFITNLKRSPPSPLPANLQDSPEAVSPPEAGSHTPLASQQVQPLQTPSGHTNDSPSASPEVFAEALPVAASSSQEKPRMSAISPSSSTCESSGTSSSAGQGEGIRAGSVSGTEQGLKNLEPLDVMSRGGPVYGDQVGTTSACTRYPSMSWQVFSGRSVLILPVLTSFCISAIP